MRSFKRRGFVRSMLSVLAVLGLVMTVFGAFAPQPARADHSQIHVVVRLCDEDLSGMDFFSGLASCPTFADGWPVTLSDGASLNLLQNTVGGVTSFTGLSIGVGYALWPSFLPPYSAAHAVCSVSDASGTEVSPAGAMFVTATGVINIGFMEDGHQILCDFLLYTPAPPQTMGTATVNKSTCPEGFDGYSASQNELAANCQDASTIASFGLADVNGGTQSQTTPGAAINEVVFSGVPTGAFSLTEDEIDGYGMPRVFCNNRGVSSPDDPTVEVPVTGMTADYELKPGYEDAFCQWYNIAAAPAGATIVVYKYACPDGYRSSDPSELSAACTEPYDPITFKLDGASSGNPGDQETGSVIPNGVYWSGLDTDTFYIHEFVPVGYDEPIVFCKLISNDDLSESALEQVPVEQRDDGVRIVRNVAELYTLECSWYNTTGTPQQAGVYLHKYGCPATYDSDWSLDEWVQNCTTIVRNAHFSLDYPDGSTDEQPINGIDVFWEGLAPGEYTISERQPPVWSGSEVFCASGSYSGSLGSYDRLEIGGNELTWELGADEFIDCYWFNLPAQRTTIDPNAPATLTIVKYTCPEAYDPLALEADPVEDCDELTDGVAFSLIGAQNASLDGETGDDGEGTVTFDNLRAGSYLLRETYPANTVQAFIWSCESDARIFDYPFTPFARIDATGTIMVSLVGGETLECDWYDVPTPQAGGVELTITVVQCPAGAVTIAACDEPVDEGFGVSLAATSGEGEPVDFETDENGIATGSVEPGEYDIDADEALCLGDSDAFTPDGTLELSEGEPVEIAVGVCG